VEPLKSGDLIGRKKTPAVSGRKKYIYRKIRSGKLQIAWAPLVEQLILNGQIYLALLLYL
jgi:predicted transcriptional regulator